MSDEFTTTTMSKGKTVTVSESMTDREKAEAIVKSATVADYDHNDYPYAVVEVPVLVDTIEVWLNQKARKD